MRSHAEGARHESSSLRPRGRRRSGSFRRSGHGAAGPGLPAPARLLSARRRAGAGRQDLVRGPEARGDRHLRSENRADAGGEARAEIGAAWLTDGGQNAILRFDPKTEEIKVWKLPEDTGYTNLNTAAFDKDGIHWFTGQNGIYGRLDPKSGEVKVFKAPKGRGPYGIASTPDGEVYYVSLAGSFLGKIDRATGE